MKHNYLLKKTLLLSVFLLSILMNAQVGIGTASPNPNSILDVYSTDKGVLLPRIPLSSTTLSAPLASQVMGMMVYNTSITNGLSSGIYISDGAQWVKPAVLTIGDIKHSFYPTDHNGWYLLDGRVLTSLSASAHNNATILGFATNLPNAVDKFLKAKDAVETLGNSGGNATITINQTNLPNVNFTGTTDVTGAHTHSYTDQGDTTISSISLLGIGSGADNTSGSYTTGSSGSHSHTATVSSGGSNTPITNEPAHIVTNIFVYLGT